MMKEKREMKEGSIAVISPLNATATAACVRDDEGHACMMLSGDSPSIMTLIENMATTAIMGMYEKAYERDGEDKALELIYTSGNLLHKHIMDSLLSEAIKEKVKRECKDMPDELAGIVARGMMDFLDKQKKTDDEDEEKESED